MATATGVKRKTVGKMTEAQKDAALRLKQATAGGEPAQAGQRPDPAPDHPDASEGEKHVGALCEPLNQSQPATSHHLALLRHGSIVAPHRQGKNNFYGLTETGEKLASVVKTVIG